jgi:hypothetical protein
VATAAGGPAEQSPWIELISGWHAAIGKAVLQSWRFADEMCDAVGDQGDLERKWKREAKLTEVLIASLLLADALQTPEPRTLGTDGVNAFLSIGVTPADCTLILTEAAAQIRQVHEALA